MTFAKLGFFSDNNQGFLSSNLVDFEKFIFDYNQEKYCMVSNYKLIRRTKRNIHVHSMLNHIFAKEFDPITKKYDVLQGMPSLLKLKESIPIIDSKYWDLLLHKTNLINLLSYSKRKEWEICIKENQVPKFNEENILLLLKEFKNNSAIYFADRIESVLSSLSPNHLTNSKFGFGEKLIIEKIHEGFSLKNANPSIISEKAHKIDDLRKIVRFIKDMNVDFLNESLDSYNKLSAIIYSMSISGKKTDFYLDDDIFIKVYKNGNAHICIEPSVAEVMNGYLAAKYPLSIPNSIKNKTYFKGQYDKNQLLTKTKLNPDLVNRSYDALKKSSCSKSFYTNVFFDSELIENFGIDFANSVNNTSYSELLVFEHSEKYVLEFVSDLLGLDENEIKSFSNLNTNSSYFYLSLNISRKHILNLLNLIIANNYYVDDKKTYQQYYTKNNLKNIVYSMLGKEYTQNELLTKKILEPSSGTGGLLDIKYAKNTTCVDISLNNTFICKSMGFDAINIDFVEYYKQNKFKQFFDVCLMNPPFTQNQAHNHLLMAYDLLSANNGVLIAILPSSLYSVDYLSILNCSYIEKSDIFDNEFDGTQAKVFILKIKK